MHTRTRSVERVREAKRGRGQQIGAVPHLTAQLVWPAAMRLPHVHLAVLQVRLACCCASPHVLLVVLQVHWPAAVGGLLLLI